MTNSRRSPTAMGSRRISVGEGRRPDVDVDAAVEVRSGLAGPVAPVSLAIGMEFQGPPSRSLFQIGAQQITRRGASGTRHLALAGMATAYEELMRKIYAG